jgi:precorrin-8X/cobalt-precorrin-8 methylmutase
MENIMRILPGEIEKKSFEIITRELGDTILDKDKEEIIKRVIHTTADFEYVDNLAFSENVVEIALQAIRSGTSIVTDTQMAKSGINKRSLAKFGGEVYNFMQDEDIAEIAKKNGTTRAEACMDKAAGMNKDFIFAIGNAPTALIRLYELIQEKKLKPKLIIGVPVGFVNVVQSKELIMRSGAPFIVAKGRKGGSNVAAAICNALLYSIV